MGFNGTLLLKDDNNSNWISIYYSASYTKGEKAIKEGSPDTCISGKGPQIKIDGIEMLQFSILEGKSPWGWLDEHWEEFINKIIAKHDLIEKRFI